MIQLNLQQVLEKLLRVKLLELSLMDMLLNMMEKKPYIQKVS